MDKCPHMDYEEDVGKGCSETFQVKQMTAAVLAISAKVLSLRSRGLELLLPCPRAITSGPRPGYPPQVPKSLPKQWSQSRQSYLLPYTTSSGSAPRFGTVDPHNPGRVPGCSQLPKSWGKQKWIQYGTLVVEGDLRTQDCLLSAVQNCQQKQNTPIQGGI